MATSPIAKMNETWWVSESSAASGKTAAMNYQMTKQDAWNARSYYARSAASDAISVTSHLSVRSIGFQSLLATVAKVCHGIHHQAPGYQKKFSARYGCGEETS